MWRGKTTKVRKPALRDIKTLSDPALRKLHAAAQKYEAQSSDYERRKKAFDLELSRRCKETELLEVRAREESKRLEVLLADAQRRLAGSRASLFRRLLTDDLIEHQGAKYLPQARPDISAIDQLNRRLEELRHSLREAKSIEWSLRRSEPNAPEAETHVSVAGARLRANLDVFHAAVIECELARRAEEQRTAAEKMETLRARATAEESQVRRQAQQHRRRYLEQRSYSDLCPYCAIPLPTDVELVHLDHIYPVKKGGHSVWKNLVFVCQPCNLKKGDKTLRNFLRTCGLTESDVYRRLEWLGKDF